MIIVEACEECNNLKSKDDDYFRDFLVTDLSNSKEPIAQRLLHSKTIKSVKLNSSSFAKQIQASKVEYISVLSNKGEKLVVIETDLTRLNNIIEKMIKGLYYAVKGKIIPQNITIEITRFQPDNQTLDTLQMLVTSKTYQCYKCGDGDVFYVVRSPLAEECEFSFNWFLFFYQNICFQVNTGLLVEDSKTL